MFDIIVLTILVFPEMSIKRFSECIVFDLWNKPWGKKRPNALVLGMLNAVNDSFDGVELVLDSPSGSLEKIMTEHILVKTEQYEGGKRSKDRLRWSCRIGAQSCLTKDHKKTRWECGHVDCMTAEYVANRNTARGVFICGNALCLKTHCQQVWSKRHVPEYPTETEEDDELW